MSRRSKRRSGTAHFVKGFGRLRTKASNAGTRGPHALVYGQMGFGMVLAGRRCRSGLAAAGPIEVISCGVRMRATLILLAGVPCAWLNSGMGMRWLIGQNTMGVTVVQGEPYRIMARVSGRGMLARVVRAVGTSGQTSR